jgi:hypothetical protein
MRIIISRKGFEAIPLTTQAASYLLRVLGPQVR